jgi:hypothetical protein
VGKALKLGGKEFNGGIGYLKTKIPPFPPFLCVSKGFHFMHAPSHG